MRAFVVSSLQLLIYGLVVNLALSSSLSPMLNLVHYIWLYYSWFFCVQLYSAVLCGSLLFGCLCTRNSCRLSTNYYYYYYYYYYLFFIFFIFLCPKV